MTQKKNFDYLITTLSSIRNTKSDMELDIIEDEISRKSLPESMKKVLDNDISFRRKLIKKTNYA